MRNIKTQISLRIHPIWSDSAFVVCCLDSITPLVVTRNLKTLASLCLWAGRFESYLVTNPRRQVFSWRGSFKGLTTERFYTCNRFSYLRFLQHFWGSYHNICQERSRKEPVSVEFFWVLCHCPDFSPATDSFYTDKWPLTCHYSTWCNFLLFWHILQKYFCKGMILCLSTDGSGQTVQTDIRLKAQFRPSLK